MAFGFAPRRSSTRFPLVLLAFLIMIIAVTWIGCGGSDSSKTGANLNPTANPSPGAPNPPSGGTTGSSTGTTSGGSTGSGTGTGTGGSTGSSTGSGTGGSTAGSTGGSTTGTTGGGTGGGTGSGSSSTTPKFVYVMNGTAGTNSGVAEFRIDPATGVLTLFGNASVPVTNTNEGPMAATPQIGGFVYVAQWFTKTIVLLRADPDSGVLTQSRVVSVPELQSPTGMITDPAGKFLFMADGNGFQIFVFSIQASGDLLPVGGSPVKISQPPQWLTMDASGKFLFVTADHEVFGFTVAGNGALTPTTGSPVTVRPAFISVGKGEKGVRGVIDLGARCLFFSDAINPVMYVFSVGADGALTPVPGSPFQTGMTGFAPAVDPSGRFVFIGGAIVPALSVNQATGALTPVPGSPFDNGPFRSGGAPVPDATVDPSGKFLLLADSEQSKITVFSIDQNSGVLTNVNGSPFPVAAQPIGGGSPSNVAVTH
jgi:Lactonase, 7-bladed beta-propeller